MGLKLIGLNCIGLKIDKAFIPKEQIV